MRLGEIHNAAIRDGLIEGETYNELEFYGNDLIAFHSSDQTTNLFLYNFKAYKNFYVNKMQNISATILVLFLKERKTSLCVCCLRKFLLFLMKMVKSWTEG